METPTTLRHKRLRNFMLDKLKEGSCPGVEWINKSEGEFKIEWVDIKQIDSKDVPEKFKIFVEWARHTGKHKEEDRPDYTKYKTQLRSALRKLDDFIETTEREKKQNFRSWKFKDWNLNNPETMSPDSTVVIDNEPLKHEHYIPHQTEAYKSQPLQAEAPLLPSFLQPEQMWENPPRDIPFFDQKRFFYRNTNSNYFRADHPPGSFQHSIPVEHQSQQHNVQSNHMTNDIVSHAMNLSDIVEPSSRFDNALQTSFAAQDKMSMDSTDSFSGSSARLEDETNGFKDLLAYVDDDETSSNSFTKELAGSSSALPSDLQSISFASLLSPPTPPSPRQEQNEQILQVQNTQNWNFLPAPYLEECKGRTVADENQSLLQNESCSTLYSSQMLDDTRVTMSARGYTKQSRSQQPFATLSVNEQPALPEEKECAGLPQQVAHEMIISLYYGRPKTLVGEWEVSARGCRMYFGKKVFDEGFGNYKEMYGPQNYDQLEMPSVDEVPERLDKIKKSIAEALKKLARGLILTIQDGDIYAEPLSHCKFFAMDTPSNSTHIQRLPGSPKKVFDFQLFKESYEKGKTKRNPYVIITFGREVNLQCPRGDPLDNTLVYAFVSHKEALDMAKAQSSGQENVSSIDELTLSTLNSMDKLEQTFREMTVK